MSKIRVNNDLAEVMLDVHQCDQLRVWLAMTKSETPICVELLRVEQTTSDKHAASISVRLELTIERARRLGLELLGAVSELSGTTEKEPGEERWVSAKMAAESETKEVVGAG